MEPGIEGRVSGSADDSFGPKPCLPQKFNKPEMASLPARQCHTPWEPRTLRHGTQWQPQMAACLKSLSLLCPPSEGPPKVHEKKRPQVGLHGDRSLFLQDEGAGTETGGPS